MIFAEFLVLLMISVAVAAMFHYGFSYYVVDGTKSFYGKIVVAYLGAYFAKYFIGNWDLIPGLSINSVQIIPAVIGAMAMIVFAVDMVKTLQRDKGYSAA